MRLEITLVIIVMTAVCSCQRRRHNRFCNRVRGCEILQGSVSLTRSRTDEARQQDPPGSPGLDNYTITNATVDQKVERLKAQFLTLQSQLETINHAVASLQSGVNDLQTVDHSDWYKAGNGFLYKMLNTIMTYSQAKRACSTHRSLIASVGLRDRNFRDKILNAMNAVRGFWLWVGATDQEHEGTWVWEDGQVSSGSDINWNRGEPNDAVGGEDCASYYKKDGVWLANDVKCTSSFKVVCEASARV